jgi:hypothetical protein
MTRQKKNLSQAMESKYTALFSHWHALIISVALNYYFRLPQTDKDKDKNKNKSSREKFISFCNTFLKQHASPEALPDFFSFKDILDDLLHHFYKETRIPGIFSVLFFFFV